MFWTIILFVAVYAAWKNRIKLLDFLLVSDFWIIRNLVNRFLTKYEKIGAVSRIPFGVGFVYVPTNKKKIFNTSIHTVTLIKDGNQFDVTQNPGTPYMFSAADFEGQQLIIYNMEDETKTVLKDNEMIKPYLDY
jgi:hypothetical protein